MGKLAEFRAERAAITTRHDESKRSIHANYVTDLANLERDTRLARRALAQRQRVLWNKALEVVEEADVGSE